MTLAASIKIQKNEAVAKAALLNFLYRKDVRPKTIISELALNKWKFRADIVVVGKGVFSAFEIKTENDRLTRLPSQLNAYSLIFQQVYAVLASKHLAKASTMMDAHVGILELVEEKSKSRIVEIRPPRTLRRADLSSMLQLFPVTELRRLLRRKGYDVNGLNRVEMERLVGFPTAILRDELISFLENRYGPTTARFRRKLKGRLVKPEDIRELARLPRPVLSGASPSFDPFFEYLKGKEAYFGDVPLDVIAQLRLKSL